MYYCSGQILTFVKIAIRVQTPEGSTSLPAAPAHLQAWHEPKRKASDLAPSLHLIRHHSPGIAWLSETPTTNTRILSYRHKDPSQSHSRLWYEDPPRARYFCTYSWIARPSWFTDPTTLSDHLHVLNVVTLLLQCEQLWIMVDISAWRFSNQAGRSGQLQRDHNVQIIQLWGSKYSHPQRQLRRV